jgi:hypothetical protein
VIKRIHNSYISTIYILDRMLGIFFAISLILIMFLLYTYFSKKYVYEIFHHITDKSAIHILFNDYIQLIAASVVGIFTVSALMYGALSLDIIKKETKLFAFVAIEFRDSATRILLASTIYWWSVYSRVFLLPEHNYRMSSPLLFDFLNYFFQPGIFGILRMVMLFIAGLSVLNGIYNISTAIVFSIFFKSYNKNFFPDPKPSEPDAFSLNEFKEKFKLFWIWNCDLNDINLYYSARSAIFFFIATCYTGYSLYDNFYVK